MLCWSSFSIVSDVTKVPVCARSDDSAIPVIVLLSAAPGSPDTAT